MKLKNQLLISGAAGIVLLLLGIRLIVRGYVTAAVIILLVMCVYVVLINLWFRNFVTDPLGKLTAFSRRIADGKYGSQEEVVIDNEIGDLTGAINDMSKKIALADKTRTEFISQISHELRTPLTAITGWSETIAYDPAVQGDSLRGINIITKEAERLTRMVAELLEFTRIQDGRFTLHVSTVDVGGMVEDCMFTYSELFRHEDLKVAYIPPEEEIPPIPGDPERLSQVVLNVHTSPTAYQTFHASDMAISIGCGLNATTSCVVNVWLACVNQIPV